MRRSLFALMLLSAPAAAQDAAGPLPIVDAHVHYSHDAWEVVPPASAIAILRQAGVARAFVSSSNDDGTQMLHRLAPDIVVPVLRPYRTRGDISVWLRDPGVLDYLEDRLRRFSYAGIGEFHAYGGDADLPAMVRVVEMARRHRLFLHCHGDAAAVDRLFAHDRDATVLWAHAGFARPAEVAAALRRHANLWADLAFRSDHAGDGTIDPEWRALFEAMPDRFLLGTDTFVPERWHFIAEHARTARAWLALLPPDVAARIARGNAEALLARVGR
ncbi:MAG: hypothetical protein OHK0024_27660 [Thalassobaculales bacterium]